ncbi:MAG: bifunctional folylpolyglutamate synthase/dihydrofolate synthase [Syntrophales bacterium]|nr:bifunctional folylpolyglutamate synthase/dihydrofolate synthase [Syntrophales bacterium]MDD5233574.1 bifunctional folylpolyglutamate synthase/dihydrofolate synthase [Syntrophales bacterium]
MKPSISEVKRDPLGFLDSLDSGRIRLDLDPLLAVLRRLGDPHRRIRSVLVAGSNGKGSVSAMISSLLIENGFRTGLYTSPHLTDFRERIRIDGRLIPRRELHERIEEVRACIGSEDITYFEFATAVAFCHFRRCGTDIAVLEVGLGGRLDATNVVTPELSIITNVCMEHTEYLGKTLREIAAEKAGVIKERGVCVTGAGAGKVIEVLSETCRRRGSKLYRLGKDFRIRSGGGGSFRYRGIGLDLPRVRTPLTGRHQEENAALAIAAAEILTQKGWLLDTERTLAGLGRTRWDGRMEVVGEKPLLILDGAHNPAGAEALNKSLARDFPGRRIIFIFGVLRDKNFRRMLKTLAPAAWRIVASGIRNDRALSAGEVAAEARRRHNRVFEAECVAEALESALAMAGPDDLVCVTGSLYLVGEAKMLLEKVKAGKKETGGLRILKYG